MRLKGSESSESTLHQIVLSLVLISVGFRRETTATDVGDRSKTDSRGSSLLRFPPALPQAPFKIAAVETNSFLFRESTPSGDTVTGYLADLVQEIAKAAHFRYEWLIVDEKEASVRRKRKNGNTWAELTEKLINGKVNVSVLPLNSANTNHTRRFTYTRPFLRTTISLLVRAPTSPFDNRSWLLENLLNETDRSRFGFGVTNEMVASQLKISNVSFYQQIWNDKLPSEVVLSLDEGLRKVREGDFALILESTDAAYLSSQEPCDLLAVGQFTHETSYVFATKRNSSLVRELDSELERLEARNFYAELFRKWWGTDECTFRRDGMEEPDDFEVRDLDMERIFFTSPIKFFKSAGTSATLSSSSLSTTTEHLPVLSRSVDYHTDRSKSLSENAQSGLVASHTITPKVSGESHRKRNRTITASTPSTRRMRTEVSAHRKSQRRSRTRTRMTTTTSPNQFAASAKEDQTEAPDDEIWSDTFTVDYRTLHRALDSPTIPTVNLEDASMYPFSDSDGAHSGHWEEDSIGSDDPPRSDFRSHVSSSRAYFRTPATTQDVGGRRPTKPVLGVDLDWFFVTHEPRISENVVYDLDPEYDEHTEQRAAIEDLDVEDKTKSDTGVKIQEITYKPKLHEITHTPKVPEITQRPKVYGITHRSRSTSNKIGIPGLLIVLTSITASLLSVKSIHCYNFH